MKRISISIVAAVFLLFSFNIPIVKAEVGRQGNAVDAAAAQAAAPTEQVAAQDPDERVKAMEEAQENYNHLRLLWDIIDEDAIIELVEDDGDFHPDTITGDNDGDGELDWLVEIGRRDDDGRIEDLTMIIDRDGDGAFDDELAIERADLPVFGMGIALELWEGDPDEDRDGVPDDIE